MCTALVLCIINNIVIFSNKYNKLTVIMLSKKCYVSIDCINQSGLCYKIIITIPNNLILSNIILIPN